MLSLPNDPPPSPFTSASERKRLLLQDYLPGVTLYDDVQTHHRRQASGDQSLCSYSSTSYQQTPLESTDDRMSTASYQRRDSSLRMNPRKDFENESHQYAHETLDDSSLHFLWIGKDDDDEDDDDDYGHPHESSLHQAAALAAARRHAERMWMFYFKMAMALMILFMFWSQMKPSRHRFRRRGHNPDESGVQPTTTPLTSPIVTDNVISTSLLSDDNILVESQWAGEEYREKILEALKNLDEEIEGDIVLLSNKTKFTSAIRVWQQKTRLSPPLAVIEVAAEQDVELALPILSGLARDYHMEFRIRSGGHSYVSEFSSVPNGVMLSLAKLNAIDFSNIDKLTPSIINGTRRNNQNQIPGLSRSSRTDDTSPKTITIQPGLTTEAFMQAALYERGFSSIVASAGGVGMGGFILGGGYGLQSRMFGLAIDNVVEMKVVLTNGQIKDVVQGDDLFWALRGAGGGNFGVVTSFEYRIYPSHDIKLEASVKVTLSDLAVFLQKLGAMEGELRPEFNLKVYGYEGKPCGRHLNSASFAKNSSSSVVGRQNATSILGEEERCGLVAVSMYWMGDANPEDQIGMTYIKDIVVPLFPGNATGSDVTYYYFSWSGMSRQREQDDKWKSVHSAQSWNGFLLPNNNTVNVWADIHASMKALFLYSKNASPKIELWGGGISKTSANVSAFPYRNALYNIGLELLVPVGSDPQGVNDEAALIHAVWPSIARHLDGTYINNPMASLSEDDYPRMYWGDDIDRLIQLKQRYDPFHVLTFSQSIPTSNASLGKGSKRLL
jgi:FAD/FMN-containing dehydrogenase